MQRALQKVYTAKINYEGDNFLGFKLKWHYQHGYVDISMPGYVDNLLSKLQHKKPTSPQYSPHHYVNIKWTAKGDRQYAQQEDDSPNLPVKDIKWVQSAVGSLLYYGRGIDCTILPALTQIAMSQANPTVNTKKAVQRLLDYVATYNNTTVRFYKSDMILVVDSDAAYLVLPKARSRYAGYFRLLDDESKPHRKLYNGPLIIECKTIKNVVSSAAEAETTGVFNNAKLIVSIRNILNELGHSQPVTVIHTDNSTTAGFANKNMQLKKSKSWDMHLHWLRDRENRKHFKVVWHKGKDSKADYFTKHHSIVQHRQTRPRYVRDTS